MTTQRQSRVIDIRTNHDKMRKLFLRFGEATGDEKKKVARELMAQLAIARTDP
jgi:hypothetical protein